MSKSLLRDNTGFLCPAVIAAFVLCCLCPGVFAMVSGPCSNCHTMHNRQNGSPVDSGGVNDNLTVTGCVGCHSDSSSNTIRLLGSSSIPVVFNVSEPVSPLAGGNYYWVSAFSDDRFGHNVHSIAGPDENLTYVPGRHIGSDTDLTITECYNCHSAGFSPGYPGIPFTIPRSGNVLICEDCHTQVMHHADDSSTIVKGSGGWYRFLYEVEGIEDPDWQQTVSKSDHNEYKGETAAYRGSISDAGCGCHGNFHALKNPGDVGTGSPWLKHPVDVALPSDGEYASYTEYNPQAPVARPDLSGYGAPSSVVTPGTDQVMCISCHRAHGSNQPDMLRWDYSTIISGGGADTGGCFICHSTKDD